MAEYYFRRGVFGRWGVPMWAGETRAFKLLRLLRKQGVTGIVYEEGPLEDYTQHHMSTLYMSWIEPRQYKDYLKVSQIMEACLDGKSPSYYKVSF